MATCFLTHKRAGGTQCDSRQGAQGPGYASMGGKETDTQREKVQGLGHPTRQSRESCWVGSRVGRALGPDSLWGKVGRRLLSGRGVSGEKRRWKDSRQRGEREGGGAWRGGRKLEGPERQPVFNLSWGGAGIPAFFRL